MTRVAYVISPIKATSHCSNSTAADSGSLDLSVSTLDQLKQGAQKYDQFRRHYPFEAKVERRTAAIPEKGDLKRIAVSTEEFKSDSWESEYRPGDIIQYYRGDFTVRPEAAAATPQARKHAAPSAVFQFAAARSMIEPCDGTT